MSFRIDDEKLLGKFKAIWTKIQGLRNIKLNTLSVYAGRYIDPKVKTYGDKVFTNFRGLNVQNSSYKIVNKQITDYLHKNCFEDQIL